MTNQIDSSIDSVLAQMRQMRMQATNGLELAPPSIDKVAKSGANSEFGSVLGDVLSKVNDLQLESGAKSSAYVAGESSDLVGTMIASQKASLGFQAVVATRNRVVSAYQDIMKMPI